jgi:LUD domain
VARVLTGRAAAVPGPFVTPDGLPADWFPADWLTARPDGIELAGDIPPRSAAELDPMAGVVTGCAVAIAETGTIILDHGPGQGRRSLTLVPDFHLVVVRADQIAADLADAFARLDPARPHTGKIHPFASFKRAEMIIVCSSPHVAFAASDVGVKAIQGREDPGAGLALARKIPGAVSA